MDCSTRLFQDCAWKKRFAARTALTRHGVLRKLRAMSQPDDFSAYVAELLDGRYDCVDRLVLNGYFPMGQTSGGLLTWWSLKLF